MPWGLLGGVRKMEESITLYLHAHMQCSEQRMRQGQQPSEHWIAGWACTLTDSAVIGVCSKGKKLDSAPLVEAWPTAGAYPPCHGTQSVSFFTRVRQAAAIMAY